MERREAAFVEPVFDVGKNGLRRVELVNAFVVSVETAESALHCLQD